MTRGLLLTVFLDVYVIGDLTILELKIWSVFAVVALSVNTLLYVEITASCKDKTPVQVLQDAAMTAGVSLVRFPRVAVEKVCVFLAASNGRLSNEVKPLPFDNDLDCHALAHEIPGSLALSFSLDAIASCDDSSPDPGKDFGSQLLSPEAPAPPPLRVIYDRFQMRSLRFQHDSKRVEFSNVNKFHPFSTLEDIRLHMDIKIQKFPSKRYPLEPSSTAFDDFLKDLTETLAPILRFGESCGCPSPLEEEFVFVDSPGLSSSPSFLVSGSPVPETRDTGCMHYHLKGSTAASLGSGSMENYTSVHLMSPSLGFTSTFPAPPINEGLGAPGVLDRSDSVLLTISLARMRAGLRGLCEQIEETKKELDSAKATATCSGASDKYRELEKTLALLEGRRRRLTCLCLKCIMTNRLFEAFSESRNASLSALHFFVDFLAAGAPDVIYSVPATACKCPCGLYGQDGESSEASSATVAGGDPQSPPLSLGSADSTAGGSPGGSFGRRSAAFVPSTNVQLLKLIYDFYILRLHQTRRAHYQSLNLGRNNSSIPGNATNNSYDEPTYRYIMLLRSMLDTISSVLCLRMPQGARDLDIVLRFTGNLWGQAHLSKSAKNSSVYILFVAVSLVHRGLLLGSAAAGGLELERRFVDICAQALQYRVADVRLHVRRNYWLVRTVHPDLHALIQKAIKEQQLQQQGSGLVGGNRLQPQGHRVANHGCKIGSHAYPLYKADQTRGSHPRRGGTFM